MSRKPVVTLSLLAAVALTPAAIAGEDEHHGEGHHSPFEGMPLIMLMQNMQYHVHKLGLAVDANNPTLEDFYAHEMEEVIDAVSEIEDYEGIPIAENLKKTLMPAFEQMEAAIDKGEREPIDSAYNELITGCNNCHAASEHGYTQIRRNHTNPYPQDFSPHD